jgi:hypothetical protein
VSTTLATRTYTYQLAGLHHQRGSTTARQRVEDHDRLAPREVVHLDARTGDQVQVVACHREENPAGGEDLVVRGCRLVQRQSEGDACSATADANPHVAGVAVLPERVGEELPCAGGDADPVVRCVVHVPAPERGPRVGAYRWRKGSPAGTLPASPETD